MNKILFIMSPMDSSYTLNKIKTQLENSIIIEIMNSYDIDEKKSEFNKAMEEIESSDIVFITCHGGITYFKSLTKILDRFNQTKKFFMYSGVEEENRELLKKSNISMDIYSNILKYYLIGDEQNLRNMIFYLVATFKNKQIPYEKPIYPKWEGVYYPGKIIENHKNYIEEIRKFKKPIIAIIFYNKDFFAKKLQHIDAFIKTIEKLNAIPLAIYTSTVPKKDIGCRGFKYTLDNILMDNEKPVVDAVIDTIGYSQSILSSPGDGEKTIKNSIFEKLNVPIFHAISTYESLETWKKSIRGLNAMSLAGEVYYPEFDGQIITVTTCCGENVLDEIGYKFLYKPIDERINKVCSLALNWVKLKLMDNKDKKVAIILHNMPPRNDMIGSAYGLDSPKSVFNMVNALKQQGIYLQYNFKHGDEIINAISDGVTNDLDWLSDEKVAQKSVDRVDKTTYESWFNEFSKPVKEHMVKNWDFPLGDFMNFEDTLPIPGILNGNVFIGLQPSRGFKEKADEMYHNTDVPPTHQYIGFYKWIKHVFKADVIIHVGTHGTLEWLPGKEVGLSNECYPDICISDIPHLYPYNVGVVGEGIQAKRRSHAVIIDHLIPSLVKSDTYDDMTHIDDLIKQYYESKQGNTLNLKYIKELLIDLCIKNKYDLDLNICKEDMENNFDDFIQKLHGLLEEIKNTFIKDGLHVLGQVPNEERFENLLYALLVVSREEETSLIEEICKLKGFDYFKLKNNPYEISKHGKTNLMILNDLDNLAREIIHHIHKLNYKTYKIYSVLDMYFEGKSQNDLKDLYELIYFACTTIKDKLNSTVDEIKYLINGVNGGFVLPSQGGSPMRGNMDILPTGRNFYSVDPTAIPSKAAWKVGKDLGDKLIEKYLKDEGKYPENIAMVVYAGETMNTCGDDIAEVLYLMGVKPKWLGNSDKVIGIEKIPIEKLKRPRIDVTLRISGLFRDTFPNIINLVDDAVNMVVSLEEDDDINYIRKNVLKDINSLVKQGKDIDSARDEATIRIFGCPPGNYGVGIDSLIESKNWNSTEDLGNMYTVWAGHAYGRNNHGKNVKKVLEKRLENMDVTVENLSSSEMDILDVDDFYEYHGGLISAVKTYSKKMPKSYCGDNINIDSVKVKDVQSEIAKVMRSRILNPKWINGLKMHGYKGAQEVSQMVDYTFGWDATANVVKDWMYDKIAEKYVLNEENKNWIKDANPWAMHNMIERLLEANQRGMWNAKEDMIDKLKKLYIDIEGDVEELT